MSNVITSRADYLRFMGLKWDPFATAVAEQELAFSASVTLDEQIRSQTPLTFFISPKINEKPILSLLQKPQPAVVFGVPGQGKTTLRLALTALSRRTQRNRLVVTFTIPQNLEGKPSWEMFAPQLSKQGAVDLFVQIVEHFNPILDKPTDEQIKALADVLAFAGRPLARLIHRIVTRPELDGRLGLADRWHAVDRLPVRMVQRTPALLQLIENIAEQMKRVPTRASGDWQRLVEVANMWGFEEIFVLIDGVDTWHRSREEMWVLIEPFLHQLPTWENGRIYGKFFLPTSLKENVLSLWPKEDTNQLIELQWSKEQLSQLLHARLAAGGSRRVNLNGFVHPEWQVDLTEMLIEAAQGSPRQLLKMTSALIDAHLTRIRNLQLANNHFHKSNLSDETINLITRADWEQMSTQFL